MAANTGMNGNHSSNIPTVEDPIPIAIRKIGMVTRELLPLKILRSAPTAPSNAPDLMMNVTEQYVMNTRNEISAALTIPS